MGANNNDKLEAISTPTGQRTTSSKRKGPSKAELLKLIEELRNENDPPAEVLHRDQNVRLAVMRLWEERRTKEEQEAEAKVAGFIKKVRAKLKPEETAAGGRPALTVVKNPLDSGTTAAPSPPSKLSKVGLTHKGIGDALGKQAKELAERLDKLHQTLKVTLPECAMRSMEEALACRGELCRAIMAVQEKRREEGLPGEYQQTLQRQYNRLQELIDGLNPLIREGYKVEPRGLSASREVYQKVRLELLQKTNIGELLHLPEPPKVETEAEQAEREARELAKAGKRSERNAMVEEITNLLIGAGMEKDGAKRWAESIAKKQAGKTAKDKLIAAAVGKLIQSGHVARGEGGGNGNAIQENIALAELAAKAAGISIENLEKMAEAHQEAEDKMAEAQKAAAARSLAKIPVETRSPGEQRRAQEAAHEKGGKKKKGGNKNGGQKGHDGNKGRRK